MVAALLANPIKVRMNVLQCFEQYTQHYILHQIQQWTIFQVPIALKRGWVTQS